MTKSKVYFTKTITPKAMVTMYEVLEKELKGKVGIKLHSGEVGNQNFLRPTFMEDIVKHVGGTIVECNTAYEGMRDTTDKHKKLMEMHGWTKFFDVDILDSEGPDIELAIPNGKKIKSNFVGKNLANYNSMLVLSHFKGHPMGGYGGAIKQLSIGVASSYGKKYIHGVGVTEDFWNSDHDSFLEAMADAASSVVEYLKGNFVYVNVMKNLSVDCDCCAVAEDPCMKDIGILVSADPVAIDRACVDLVYASKDKGRDHLVERIETRNGVHTIDVAEELGLGNKEYELIMID